LAALPPAALRLALARLGKLGAALSVPELVQRLLALSEPVEDRLARRLLAAVVGCPAEVLPDPIHARDLARLAHGPIGWVALERAEFVVVDLETTGLTARSATILEIGAVRISGLQARERFETLVDPQGAIPAGITALTGIDAASVAGAPGLAEAVAGFSAWLQRAPGAPFVAHNARFDEGFVRSALAQLGLPPLDRPVLCTRKLARRLLPELGRYGLDALSAHFGISNHARHRALGDAEAAARALLELIQRATEQGGLRTVGDLLELQAAPPARGQRGPARGAGREHR
jgi:DNA polymerase-3 subunit epsilon